MKQENIVTLGMEAAKGTPPVVVSAAAQAQSWSGADIVTTLTIAYLLLQICWLLWQWRKAAKATKAAKAAP